MTTAAPGRVVVFRVGRQLYAMDVLSIERVIRHVPPRPVPMGSGFIDGVIEHEGHLIPVVDLGARLLGDEASGSAPTRVLLMRDGHGILGLAVDQVLDVRGVEGDDLEPTPAAITRGQERPIYASTMRRGSDVVLVVEPSALVRVARGTA